MAPAPGPNLLAPRQPRAAGKPLAAFPSPKLETSLLPATGGGPSLTAPGTKRNPTAQAHRPHFAQAPQTAGRLLVGLDWGPGRTVG